jgi:hypothetical protein
MTNRAIEVVADRDFKFSEKKIARRLSEVCGLGMAEIKFLARALVEGEHWKKTARNGEIALTATAVQLICRGVATPPHFLVVGDCLLTEPSRQKNGPAPVLALPPAPIKMRVMRKLHNPRVLDAVDEAGKVCHVIVGDSEPYAYGAEFTALPSKQHQGFYEVASKPIYSQAWRNRPFTR